MPATRDALRASGTIAADAQAVPISPNGRGCVAIELSGTWVINLDVKSVVDGTEENAKIYNAAGSVVSLPLTTNQIVYAYAAGREQIIVRANGYTSGSAAVVLNATDFTPFIASAGGGGGGGAVTAANPGDFVDGWDSTFGAKADAAAAADNSTATYMALFKRLLARLTTLLPQNSGRLNVDGAGGTFPVTNSNLDAATSTLLTISDFDTKAGSLTETAPATDTASSGLNGRLQRIAQRLTSLITLLPSALVSNRLDVNLGAAPALVTVQGDAAVAAAVAGNPLAIGGRDASGNAQFIGGNNNGVFAQGPVAAGSALAGNPLLMGVSDGSNIQNLKQATGSSNSYANTGVPVFQQAYFTGTNTLQPMTAVSNVGDAASGQLMLASAGMAFNGGSQYDRIRNNINASIRADATGLVASTVNTDITTYNAAAFMYHAHVSNYNGGSLTVKLQWKDANGLFVDIPGATTGALTSGADIILAVGPSAWPANTATAFYVNYHLPRLIRVVETTSVTVTLGAAYELTCQ